MKRLSRIVTLIGGIGADPVDSEQVRLLKRIWTITLAAAVPLCAGLATTYAFMDQWTIAAFWIANSVFWIGSLFLLSVLRKNIESFALSSQTFLVISSFAITCLAGGFFRSDGAVFMGLIGVLYAMVFPNRKRAFFIFLLYLLLFAAALVLELTVFRADTVRPFVSTLFFWLTLIFVAVFTVLAIYYFVGQRDRNFKLLQAEKERSENLIRRIEKDLELAAKIQRDFLPRHDPRMERFDISGSNTSCFEVGGDYYDFVPIDPYRLGIAVGDVSGKGMGAALLMAAFRAAFRAEVHPRYRIPDMAAKVNDFVYHSSSLSSFITFFYCEIDRNSEEVKYVNAGHNPPFVLRNDGSLETLEGTGFCLGMFPGAIYEAKSILLKPGDSAVLYSDGITESRSVEGAEYGVERLIAVLRSQARGSAAEIAAAIGRDAKNFISGASQCDDQTIVVVKRI